MIHGDCAFSLAIVHSGSHGTHVAIGRAHVQHGRMRTRPCEKRTRPYGVVKPYDETAMRPGTRRMGVFTFQRREIM